MKDLRDKREKAERTAKKVPLVFLARKANLVKREKLDLLDFPARLVKKDPWV